MTLLGQWEILTVPLADVPPEVVRVKQVHGNAIVWADTILRHVIVADGVAAHDKFPASFMINTADCLPLVVVANEVAVALHVSRKTLVEGILDRVPDFIDPQTIIHTWIGPHICADHFVFEWVGCDIAAFQARWPGACEEKKDGLHLSILSVTEHYLSSWGVREATIERDGRCTFEDGSLASYRRGLAGGEKKLSGIATVVRLR